MKRPKLAIAYRAIEGLHPAERNARTHSAEQIAQIAASVEQFGWTNPILIDEKSNVIAGHGRLAAAQLLGMLEVPTITLVGLSEAQRRALVIADNKLALNAGWDPMILADELAALKALDFDLPVIGFSSNELDQMFAEPIDLADQWQDMPEFSHPAKAFRSIVMHFRSAEDVEQFARLIDQPLKSATRFAWFPEAQNEPLIDKRFVTADAA